jgi:hypothetical protein
MEQQGSIPEQSPRQESQGCHLLLPGRPQAGWSLLPPGQVCHSLLSLQRHCLAGASSGHHHLEPEHCVSQAYCSPMGWSLAPTQSPGSPSPSQRALSPLVERPRAENPHCQVQVSQSADCCAGSRHHQPASGVLAPWTQREQARGVPLVAGFLQAGVVFPVERERLSPGPSVIKCCEGFSS